MDSVDFFFLGLRFCVSLERWTLPYVSENHTSLCRIWVRVHPPPHLFFGSPIRWGKFMDTVSLESVCSYLPLGCLCLMVCVSPHPRR